MTTPRSLLRDLLPYVTYATGSLGLAVWASGALGGALL